MNYIKSLQEENKLLKDNIILIEEELNNFIRYCNLEKFREDNYMNVSDALLRINEIKQLI